MCFMNNLDGCCPLHSNALAKPPTYLMAAGGGAAALDEGLNLKIQLIYFVSPAFLLHTRECGKIGDIQY